MTKINALPLVAIIVVSASLVACTGTAQSVQPTLKLQVVEGLPVVDGVYLNGQGPFRFLLDTGEQSNEMDPDLARKLGIAATAQRELDTPAGTTHVPAATVNEILLGQSKAEEQEFLIVRREELEHAVSNVRGTLGQQFLSHFDYTLDLRHHRISFGDSAPQGAQVDFQLSDGCMIVPTDQGGLMLDSGSQTLFLFHSNPHAGMGFLATSNSSMVVGMDQAPPLEIGNKKYHPENAVYRPVSGAPAAGLLPANLFSAIYVSNSGHFVIFDPAER